MLKINNLTIISSSGRKLIEDFSFVLNEDDKIALIGEEGNGKSTLLKVLAGESIEGYASYTGSIEREGKAGYLPQRIPEEDLELSVEDYIDREIDYNHLYLLLNRIGVDPDLISQRKLKTLSGGEKVRIAILKILYEDPDMLLLDEPSNDLDLKTLIWLEEFIVNTRLPLIFVSHDETLLENCANGILHLEQLKRKSEPHIRFEQLGYREYQQSRQAYISRNNMIASKQKAQLKKQMDKWRQIYQKVEHQQRTISRGDPHGAKMLKKKMHTVKAQGRNLEAKKENMRRKYEPEEAIAVSFDQVKINPNKVILDLHLNELKAGDRLLARDIDMKVLGRDKVCIIGDNGSGKTTLLRKIYGILKEREDLKIGYVPQNYDEMMDMEVTPVFFLMDGGNKAEQDRVCTLLGSFKFTAEEMEHRIADLSEGQKCKIYIASLILKNCNVLILDEVTRNLSPLSGPRIRQILCDYEGTIISVSHDRKYIEEVANSIYELKDGSLVMLD